MKLIFKLLKLLARFDKPSTYDIDAKLEINGIVLYNGSIRTLEYEDFLCRPLSKRPQIYTLRTSQFFN